MKRILFIAFLCLALFVSHDRVDAASCGAGRDCGWIDVSNVSAYGVPYSASAQNFYNDQATKDKLCQVRGYGYSEGGAAQQSRWNDCNAEYHVTWNGSAWSSRKCSSVSYLTSVYCGKDLPQNNAPTIRFTSAPSSALCNASYYIEAEGSDADGNLDLVSIDKDGAAFAYNGGGDGRSETSGNSTSDQGPKTVTFAAWATDTSGARSSTASHTIDVAICTAPPLNFTPTGVFSASCSSLSGTARDPDAPRQSVGVHFYADGPAGQGSFVGSTATDRSSEEYDYAYTTTGTKTYYAYAIDTQGGHNPLLGQRTITCAGSATPAASGFIGASPSSLPAGGGSATISWRVSDATSCQATGDWSGSKDKNGGSETVTVARASTFGLRCEGAGGAWSGSASVSVAAPVIYPPVSGGNSAYLAVGTSCALPGSSVGFTSNAGGSNVTSHAIEKDSNQDGVYGGFASFGSGGTQTHIASLTEGIYDFRTVVNGSVYSSPVRVTVSPSCSPTPNSPMGNPQGGGNTTGVPGTPGSSGTSGGSGSSVPRCTDPGASNYNSSGACVYPLFRLSATPSTVKAKSVAGYSGITEQEIRISVNPVSGFNAPVEIEVLPSLPADTKPEYSFAGGAFTANPRATLSWDGSFYRNNGLIHLPVLIRFGGLLEKDRTYSVTFGGVGLPGGRGAGASDTATVLIDSKPLYPDYTEI
jgi:hypothetical protein